MQMQKFNTKVKVLIIAEIGNNHEGSYSLAEEMIGLAAEAGVDAVKFQTFQTEYYISKKNKERFDMIKSFELSHEQFQKLCIVAKNQGLYFISTPFDIESALFISEIADAIKISSGDNNFFPLLEAVAKTNKPLILSTGLANINQINVAKDIVENIWNQKNVLGELAILHCVTSYPVESKFANLKAIQTLARTLDCTIGYSDHTLGIHAATVAVGLGARIIEKHFTKDKNFSDFRDHQLSADFEEMKQMVEAIREVEEMLGSGQKIPQLPEKEISTMMRRSIVAKYDLSKGDIISLDDITWIRPGGGLSPGNESKIIGGRLNKDINKGSPILLVHVE